MNYKLIVGAIIILIVGFGLGFYVGIEYVIGRALKVIPHFVDIEIDKQAISDALFKYYNNIGSCIK